MSPERSPIVDVDSRDMKGIDGGILLTANDEEKRAYQDMIDLGVPSFVAAQAIAERIAERTKLFTA